MREIDGETNPRQLRRHRISVTEEENSKQRYGMKVVTFSKMSVTLFTQLENHLSPLKEHPGLH